MSGQWPSIAGAEAYFNRLNSFDFQPSYSPDGRMIAYTGHDGSDFEIFYKFAHSGGKPVKLTDNPFSVDRNPSWGSGP